MKIRFLSLFIFLVIIVYNACERSQENPVIEDFCSVIPDDWSCEIIREQFDQNDIPRNAPEPFAVIRYINENDAVTGMGDVQFSPSLILDVYPIKQKNELIDLVKSQQMYSWCIPVYYGETDDFFILTSPCFINRGTFTEEANTTIKELQESLEKIITVVNYGLIGQ